jgi:DNA-directed RNA polymerase specialized sigma24 family protein
MSDSNDLDFRLYAWLSEADEQRAELRFSLYFKAAFPALCHYVRSLGQSSASAEDIAQQALIKLFNHLGGTRRVAAEEVRGATARLRPIASWGSMHARLVRAWLQQLTAFLDAAIGFRIDRTLQDNPDSWKDFRNEINWQIDPLRRKAVRFLDEARTRLEPNLLLLLGNSSNDAPTPDEATRNKLDESEELSVDGGTVSLTAEISRFVSMLRDCAQRRVSSEVTDGLGTAGAYEFVTGTTLVHKQLPPLAVPSNGLLYTIAKRQLIDSLRVKKREDLIADIADGGSVLDELELDSCAPPANAVAPTSTATASDPAEGEDRDRELESRYVAFVEFLRTPLTRAEGTLAAASRHGRATTEGARVASLQAKFDRLMDVLDALREVPQPTEEEIAARLDLTRNQVKYAIERIREEFTHFFPDLAGHSQGRRKTQGGDE